MFRLRMLLLVIALLPWSTAHAASSPGISIEVTPAGKAIQNQFVVHVDVESATAGEKVPVAIQLPEGATLDTSLCVGQCSKPTHDTATNIVTTDLDDAFEAHGIVILAFTAKVDAANASPQEVTATVGDTTRSAPIPLFGDGVPSGYRATSLSLNTEASKVSDDGAFSLDFDASLPYNGAVVFDIPVGLSVDESSSCVDPEKREPSNFGQQCRMNLIVADDGTAKVLFEVPSGEYGFRLILVPAADFTTAEVTAQVDGRYLVPSEITVTLPDDVP